MPLAGTRVLKTIGVLVGVVSTVFGLLTLPAILGRSDDAPSAWTALALVAALAVPVLLGVTAMFANAAVIRTLGALTGVGGLLALLSEPLVSTAAQSPCCCSSLRSARPASRWLCPPAWSSRTSC